MSAPSLDRLTHKIQIDRGSFRTDAFLADPVQIGAFKVHTRHVRAVLRLADPIRGFLQYFQGALAVTGSAKKRWEN